MIQPDIQAVFFDAGGTLFETRGSVGEIYSRAARQYGIQADPATVQAAFLRHFRSQPPLAFPPGTPEAELHHLEKEWWRRLVQQVLAEHGEFPQFAEFFDDLYEFFRTSAAWQLFAETVPTLAALKARGLRLAIISNFDSRLDDLLPALEIAHYFDAVYISSRVGAAKPDAAIFQAAVAHSEIKAAQAIHIGDSLREDTQGATAAGLRAVLLDRNQEATDNTVTRVVHLAQLLKLL